MEIGWKSARNGEGGDGEDAYQGNGNGEGEGKIWRGKLRWRRGRSRMEGWTGRIREGSR